MIVKTLWGQFGPTLSEKGDFVKRLKIPELNEIKIKVSSGMPKKKKKLWHATFIRVFISVACHWFASRHPWSSLCQYPKFI